MNIIYIEERVGDIAIGYRYYPDHYQYEKVEQAGECRAVQFIEVEDVPVRVKQAISILLEEGN